VAACLCGQRDTNDPIDASVVINAHRYDQTVITNDMNDLQHLDPQLKIIQI
jgi:hypothetical protein